MTTALYIRVSTREQAEKGFSIAGQKDRLKSFAKAKDLGKTEFYIDDGYSGSSLNRPQITRLISDVENRKIEHVIVFRLDRISRSQKDTLYLIEDVFNKNDVSFISINESFDTSTAFGRAMIGMLSVFAQLERENIKERVELGKLEKAKQGLWNGGRGNFIGYDYKNGNFTINPYEAEIVREIFSLSIEGYGDHIIHQKLKEKYGEDVCGLSTVGRTLDHPIYIGKIRYDKEIYDAHHEPIISDETFYLSKELRSKRSKRSTYDKKGNVFVLSGIIKCGKCGAGMVARYSDDKYGNYRYYVCYKRATKYRQPKEQHCDAETVRIELVHDKVFNILKNVKSDDIDHVVPKRENTVHVFREELLKIEKQIEKATDLYINDTIPIEILNKKMSELKNKKSIIEKNIKTYTPIKAMAIKELKNFQEIDIEKLEKIELKKMLSIIIDKIVYNNKQMDIHFNFSS